MSSKTPIADEFDYIGVRMREIQQERRSIADIEIRSSRQILIKALSEARWEPLKDLRPRDRHWISDGATAALYFFSSVADDR
jgi:hypothetical protein